jgi:hypothetical protein
MARGGWAARPGAKAAIAAGERAIGTPKEVGHLGDGTRVRAAAKEERATRKARVVL